MTSTRGDGLITASDGLPARRSGTWAEEKLEWLDAYLPVALTIAAGKIHRDYVDLFAGPGLNKDRETGREWEGSPLRALRAQASSGSHHPFTTVHTVSYTSEEHAALTARMNALSSTLARGIVPPVYRDHVGDANVLGPEIVAQLPVEGYVLVFADITGISHWPWETVRRLRERGAASMDLYVLLPVEMALQRFASFEAAELERYKPAIDAFFGTAEWREIYDRRVTSAQGDTFKAELITLYLDQLRTLWRYAGEMVRAGETRDKPYYRMLFATDHEAAMRAAIWAKERRPNIQMQLF